MMLDYCCFSSYVKTRVTKTNEAECEASLDQLFYSI